MRAEAKTAITPFPAIFKREKTAPLKNSSSPSGTAVHTKTAREKPKVFSAVFKGGKANERHILRAIKNTSEQRILKKDTRVLFFTPARFGCGSKKSAICTIEIKSVFKHESKPLCPIKTEKNLSEKKSRKTVITADVLLFSFIFTLFLKFFGVEKLILLAKLFPRYRIVLVVLNTIAICRTCNT